MWSKVVVACIALCAPLVAWADGLPPGQYLIDSTVLTIPVPTGFVPILYELLGAKTTQNRLVTMYAPKALLDAAQKVVHSTSEERSAWVETPIDFEQKYASGADFEEFKQIKKRQLTEAVAQDEDVFALSQHATAMKPHLENKDTLAWTSLLKTKTDGSPGTGNNQQIVKTSTLVHVKGKILYFYVCGQEGDVDWTRKASKGWVDAVLATNP